MAKPQTPLEMTQGSTFSTLVQWTNDDGTAQDLTNYDFKMQLRRSYQANTVSESLSITTGEIQVTANTGSILLTLPPNRTANLFVDYTSTSRPPKTVYVYDLEYTDPTGFSDKLISGTVTVYGEVTR